jgi:hypothetical protein
MNQNLCQERVYRGIRPITRKFKEKEDCCPFSREDFSSFLGNNLELLGKVLPLFGFLNKWWNWKKVYLNCHD